MQCRLGDGLGDGLGDPLIGRRGRPQEVGLVNGWVDTASARRQEPQVNELKTMDMNGVYAGRGWLMGWLILQE
jgi:hypothetical protein